MSNTKKIKGPWRPKSNFKNLLKNKEDKHIIRGRGRPKKHIEVVEDDNLVDKELKWVVDEKVAREKKKDTIILLLFLFSVLLFVFSILSSFLQNKKDALLNIKPVIKQEKVVNKILTWIIESNNINSGNTLPITNQVSNTWTLSQENINTNPERKVTQAWQAILDFYDAFNAKDIQKLNGIADTHLRSSSVFKTYFNLNWISKFLLGINQSKVFVLGIVETEDVLKANIKNIEYSITYRVNNVSDKFVEQRSATLIQRWEEWKIGKIMCVTPWCSQMPFFNPTKYGIK